MVCPNEAVKDYNTGRFSIAIPEMLGAKPKYSPHAYDAAQIKNANDARWVAHKVGGNIHRFNPLNGEVV